MPTAKSASSDPLRDKLREHFESMKAKEVPAAPAAKIEEERVGFTYPAKHRPLSAVLKDSGRNDLASSLPFDPPVREYKAKDWNITAGSYIPEASKFEHFLPSPYHLAHYALAVFKRQPVLLTGDPGTGKTTLPEFFCSLVTQPFFRFNGNATLEVSDIIGHVGYVEGVGTQWVDGVLTRAMREGYAVVHDEFFRNPSFLPLAEQGLLDKGGVLRLLGKHDDDILKPDPRTVLVYTDNTRGTGDGMDKFSTTQVHDTSFINRIKKTIVFDYMDSKEEVKSLAGEYGVDEETVKGLVKLASLCRTAYRKGELSLVLSKRQLETVCSDLPYLGTKEAMRVCFYNSLPEDEAGVFEELWQTVFSESW